MQDLFVFNLSEPCTTSGYEVTVIDPYDSTSFLGCTMVKSFLATLNVTLSDADANEDTNVIRISYSSTDTTVSKQETLLNFNSFVSSVGGSLGLFVGFSVLSTLQMIYNSLAQRFHCNGGVQK